MAQKTRKKAIEEVSKRELILTIVGLKIHAALKDVSLKNFVFNVKDNYSMYPYLGSIIKLDFNLDGYPICPMKVKLSEVEGTDLIEASIVTTDNSIWNTIVRLFTFN